MVKRVPKGPIKAEAVDFFFGRGLERKNASKCPGLEGIKAGAYNSHDFINIDSRNGPIFNFRFFFEESAAKFEAEGELEASKIRSEAELEAARIKAKGAEEQARIRGESAAQVAKTYADAHRTNPELYRFTRSIESMDKLVKTNTNLILRTDSEPFSLLQGKEK